MIYIGADHAGFELKQKVIDKFTGRFVNLGTDSTASCDYPIFAKNVCLAVLRSVENRGILICGTGTGMSICANKFSGIRAANCWNPDLVALAREHNNINVLCIGARFITENVAIDMVSTFLNTQFSQEPRHIRRLEIVDG